jgi:hypothetical protein
MEMEGGYKTISFCLFYYILRLMTLNSQTSLVSPLGFPLAITTDLYYKPHMSDSIESAHTLHNVIRCQGDAFSSGAVAITRSTLHEALMSTIWYRLGEGLVEDLDRVAIHKRWWVRMLRSKLSI